MLLDGRRSLAGIHIRRTAPRAFSLVRTPARFVRSLPPSPLPPPLYYNGYPLTPLSAYAPCLCRVCGLYPDQAKENSDAPRDPASGPCRDAWTGPRLGRAVREEARLVGLFSHAAGGVARSSGGGSGVKARLLRCASSAGALPTQTCDARMGGD